MGKKLSDTKVARYEHDGLLFPVDENRPQADYGADERAFHTEAVARFREANGEQTLRYETV